MLVGLVTLNIYNLAPSGYHGHTWLPIVIILCAPALYVDVE